MADSAAIDNEEVRAQLQLMNAYTHLLKPPAEVRNIIYYEIITVGEQRLQNCPDIRPPTPVAPNILTVSRQLREETLPIFYGENTFIIGKLDLSRRTASSWIRSLATDSFAYLRNLTINVTVRCDCEEEMWLWNRSHPMLRNLEVAISRTNEGFRYSLELESEQADVADKTECIAAQATKNLAGAMLCCFGTYDWGQEGKEKMIELLEMLGASQDVNLKSDLGW